MSSDYLIEMYEAHLKREGDGVANEHPKGCWYCGCHDHRTADCYATSMGIPEKVMDEMKESVPHYGSLPPRPAAWRCPDHQTVMENDAPCPQCLEAAGDLLTDCLEL